MNKKRKAKRLAFLFFVLNDILIEKDVIVGMPKWTSEQLDAIEKCGTNIIVSAGAGSGKTAVLTSRVISKLEDGVHIDELLILTFTNAAAREMKERIRSSIKKNINLKNELDKIDVAYITTFDSYALSIVKKYHYLLNVSKNIKIVDSSIINIKRKKILDEVMDELYDKPSISFSNFINNYCNKDDEEIKSAINSFICELEKKGDYQNYLDNYINNYYSNDSLDKLIDEYKKILILKQEELKDALEEYGLYADNKEYNKMNDALLPVLKDVDSLLLNINVISLPRLVKASDEVKMAKDSINLILKELKELCKYGSFEDITNNIISTRDNVSVIIDIINRFNLKYNEIKYKEELFDFQDIALMAIKIVKENNDVRDELKNKYKEIMIDEYQDTNDIQETFINYISNNNVYMVGDIKQSIYRFRNANPYLFKSKYDNYSMNNGGIKIDLLKNFRSREEVLDDINLLFNRVMDDNLGGANYIDTHQMVYGNLAYKEFGETNQNNHYDVLYYNYDKELKFTKEEIEIFTVANDINEKVKNHYKVFDKDNGVVRDITYSDFVILMDRSKDFNTYKKIFEYLNIPLTLYKDESFKDSEDLLILKNILVLLYKIYNKEYDVGFRYALTSIARSYLYNIDDSEIFIWFKNHDYYHNDIYKSFNELSKKLNSITNYELFNEIFIITNIYEKLILVGDIKSRSIRLTKMLEIASNLDELGYDFIAVKDYLEEVVLSDNDMKYSLNSLDNDSVKIMTIHKSKGLEYHICYFTGLYKTFNISDLKDKFIFNNKYGFIIPYYKDGMRECFVKQLLKHNYLVEEISEKIRLFYVALTRCKEKMILILPNTDKEINSNSLLVKDSIRLKYRSFADIIYSVKNSLNKYSSIIDINKLGLTTDYKYLKDIEKYSSDSDTKLVVEEVNIENDVLENKHFSKSVNSVITKEDLDNIELGKKFHKVLEMIDLQNYDELEIDDLFIREKVNNLVGQLNINGNEIIYQEYEFKYVKDCLEYHGIIDLMIEYDDHIDIIDYKLKNIVDDNYLKQLNGYCDYINSFKDKNISMYLYSILDGNLVKIDRLD